MNTFSGYTLSDPSGLGAKKALQVDALPHLAALSGASPTAYFVWRQVMEQASKGNSESDSEDKQMDEFPQQPLTQSYNDLHLSTFQTFDDEHELSGLIENSPMAELNKQDHNGNTPLIWAASEGREDIVTMLVEQGADINCQNYEGETALYVAAARGHVQMVEFLCMNGANLNIANIDGATPLHIAAAEGHVDVLRVLTQYGGQPSNVQDFVGDCLLHYAVRESQMEVVQYLVHEARVDVNMRNEDLETPLELAQCLGETTIVQFLWAAQCGGNARSGAMMSSMMSCEEMEDLTNEQPMATKAFPSVVGDFQHYNASSSSLFSIRC